VLSLHLHRKIFLLASVLLAAALPLSPFLVSISQFILVGNWLLEPNFRSRISLLLSRKSILLLLSIYFVHFIWLINSEILTFGLHDLKIKAPLLLLPLIYGTSVPFTKRELNFIFHTYLLACLVAIMISITIYFNLTKIEVNDIREISPIISHIRLSLLIVLAIYLIIYFFIFYREGLIWPKFIYLFLLFVFLIFVPWLGALTGSVILLFVMPFAVIIWLRNKRSRNNYLIGITIVIFITTSCIAYLYYSFNRFTNRNKIITSELPLKSINGNSYFNDTLSISYENQYPIWIQICDVELEKEWNLRSKLDYYGLDLKKQILRPTIIRYITSMGLPKDSLGITTLSGEDIRMIENGYTNYLFKYKWSVYPRLYQIFWEIEYYIKGGNPSGHSLTQRVEYLKNALHIIKRHFWFGIGTGDTAQEIKKQYELDNSQLSLEWRNRAHNQLVTFFLSFGLVGFLWIVFAFSLAIYLERKNADFLFICFLLIFLFSTLNEDTLETQIGATYYAFFLSLLLLGRNIERPLKSDET
jgi:hypothetical protein